MFKFCARLAAVVAFFALASSAFAEGFALYEYSARGISLGGAMMARKPDPSAVAYNPALITHLPGIQVMAGGSMIHPRGKMLWENNTGSGGAGLRDSLWFIPHAYYTQQLTDDLFFGVGEFSRYGLGFEYPHNWPGRFNIYEVSLMSASINPVLAWKATDKLSLAAGPEVVYVNLDMRKRAQVDMLKDRAPALAGIATFEVDSNIQDANAWGLGGNIAGHYQFNDEWAVGLQYRSQVRVHAYGDVEYSYMGYTGPAMLPGGIPGEAAAQGAFKQNFKDGGADAVVILPDSIAGGISWSPRPDLSLEVGAIWTRWSTFKNLNINVPAPIHKSRNAKEWKNVWRFNAGVEWEALDWLTFRAGYVFDQSPMTDKYADYLVPTADRHIYSAGVGFKWDAWTLDLAYAYIEAVSRSYDADERTHVVDSKSTGGMTNIVSVSLGYQF